MDRNDRRRAMRAFLGSLALLVVISALAAVGLNYMSRSVQDTYTTQNVRL
jgi:hypothetical protein